ncbi:helix-turn-helix domain-containing protein, partial [Muricoprocola aceti]
MKYFSHRKHDYSATAKEFNCSYGQVYSWVNKYSKKG